MTTIDTAPRQLHVYEPASVSVPSLVPYVRQVWGRRSLVWHLARTDMKAQHYDTAIGKVWLVLDPMLTAATFYLVRVVLLGGGEGEKTSAAVAHLIMGVSFFFFVRKLFEGAARSVLNNRNMALNTGAPRGVYPAVVLVRAVSDFAPALAVYFVVHLLTGQPFGLGLVLLPVVLVMMAVFAFGAGLAFAPLVVLVRDVSTLLPYLLRIWMYVTPVMYFVSEIPDEFRRLFVVNPLYPYYASFELMFAGEWPTVAHLLGGLAWAAVAAVIGVVAFLSKERELASRL